MCKYNQKDINWSTGISYYIITKYCAKPFPDAFISRVRNAYVLLSPNSLLNVSVELSNVSVTYYTHLIIVSHIFNYTKIAIDVTTVVLITPYTCHVVMYIHVHN